MGLPKDVERMAVRDSLLSSQRMADFDRESFRRKSGLRWWHDFTIPATIIGLVAAVLAIAVGAVLWVASLFA
jgi:hypothetical protein